MLIAQTGIAQVLGALKADPNLEKMRFWLVPQYIRAHSFVTAISLDKASRYSGVTTSTV